MAVRMQEMSKTYQYRKVMKPLLERKRRARINKCLDELKDLMAECLVQQGENSVRLEKADILELTVDHLKRLRGKGNIPSSTSASGDHSFRSGYVHAANEVSRALACYPGVDISLGTRVMAHLGHRLVQIENQKQEITMKKSSSSSSSSSLPVNSPLRVYCDSNNKASNYIGQEGNYNNCISTHQQLSPVSSGYGSDNESTLQSSRNYNCTDHHQGLLKIAATITSIETSKKNVWRPW